MRVRSMAALIAATVAAAVALTASPAQAALLTWTASCSSGGFTGYITPHYAKGPGVTEYVAGVNYKITYKGGDHAGNGANVLWHDGGTAPPTDFSTGDGIQDAGWHVLPGSMGSYQRGNGYTSVSFIFDKLGSDPRCATGKDW
jgi:prepilin-type processing-associated H-X9-DG protein